MRHFLYCSLTAASSLAALSPAAVLLPLETFNEAVGGLYTEPNATDGPIVSNVQWPAQRTLSLTNPILVEAGSLTYAGGGLPASTNNKVRLLNSGQDLSTWFPGGVPTGAFGNTYYYSAILMVESGTGNAGSTTGDYVLHFANGQNFGADGNFSGTAFRGRLYLFDDGASGVGVGVQYSSSASTRQNATTSAAFDTPFFAVVKITEVAGDDNDTAELYLFTSGAIPTTEPVTASAISIGNDTANGGSNHDIGFDDGGSYAPLMPQDNLGRLSLRQGSSSDAPQNVLIDELRAGTTWADVAPGTSDVPDWSIY